MFWSLFLRKYQNTVLWWVNFKIITLIKYIRMHTLKFACKHLPLLSINLCGFGRSCNKKIVQLRKLLHIMRTWTNSNITTSNRNNVSVEVYIHSADTIMRMDKSSKPAADGQVMLSLNAVREFKRRAWVLGHLFIYKLSTPFV